MLGIFFHPDCTVGFGITPNLLTASRDALARSRAHCAKLNHLLQFTAGREFHPALKILDEKIIFIFIFVNFNQQIILFWHNKYTGPARILSLQ